MKRNSKPAVMAGAEAQRIVLTIMERYVANSRSAATMSLTEGDDAAPW